MERAKVLVVRWSAADAIAECRRGGRVVRMEKGHAEVIDPKGYVRGFLTRADYNRFLRSFAG